MSYHLYGIKQFISKTQKTVWLSMKLPNGTGKVKYNIGLKLSTYYDLSFSTVKWCDEVFTMRYILVLKTKSKQHSYTMKQT